MKKPRLTMLLTAAAMLGSGATVRADSAIPKSYPLTICPVSDEKLGAHGKSVKATAPDGTDVYLCCKDCLQDFHKDPAKYAKMVRDAAPKK